jgi:hypothetical protein
MSCPAKISSDQAGEYIAFRSLNINADFEHKRKLFRVCLLLDSQQQLCTVYYCTETMEPQNLIFPISMSINRVHQNISVV